MREALGHRASRRATIAKERIVTTVRVSMHAGREARATLAGDVMLRQGPFQSTRAS